MDNHEKMKEIFSSAFQCDIASSHKKVQPQMQTAQVDTIVHVIGEDACDRGYRDDDSVSALTGIVWLTITIE